jgi:predicted  nucleic acid-binding Zn-ribbon protein
VHAEAAASRGAALDRQEADLKALDRALAEREVELKGLRTELAAERRRLDERAAQVRRSCVPPTRDVRPPLHS